MRAGLERFACLAGAGGALDLLGGVLPAVPQVCERYTAALLS
jgi:hypothetical protein